MTTDRLEIRSKRLLLRPLAQEDVEDVFSMRSNAVCMKYTSQPPETDIAQSIEWVGRCLSRRDCWNFSVELLPSEADKSTDSQEGRQRPRVIGLLGAIRAPEVGFMFHPDYWGKGYASEALQTFMPAFWDHYSGENGFSFSIAYCDSENVGSRKTLEKAGFVLVEIREKDFENQLLGLRDTCVLRIPRPGTTLEGSKCFA